MQTADQQQQSTSDDITTQTQTEQQPHAEQPPVDGEQQLHDGAPQGEQQTDGDGEGQDKDKDEGKKPELTPAEKEARALRRRVDRLTRTKYQSEAQLQQMQAEIAQLRGQLGHEGADDPQASAATPTAQDLQRQAREMVEFERINARCDDVVAQGEAAYTDFGDKVRELGQELPLFDQRMRPAPILQTILDSDDPAALIYHLGANPDEAAELADMTPRQQMRRLIQIEAQIGKTSDTPSATAAPSAQPRTVSKAPPPAQPNRAPAGNVTKDPSKMSDAEFFAWRKQQKS